VSLKLLFDLARVFFTRLAILLFIAFIFVAMDAYQARQDDLEKVLNQIDSSIKKLDRKKKKLEKSITKSYKTLRKINDDIEYWTTPNPPSNFTVGQKATYLAVWKVRSVKKLKELKKKREKINQKIAELNTDIQGLANEINKNINTKALAIASNQQDSMADDIINWDFLRTSLSNHSRALTLIFLALFFGPISAKAINFYLFAPLAKKVKPITINNDLSIQKNDIQYGLPQKEIKLTIDKDQSLVVKPGWYNLNTDGSTRTRLFWDWTNPFASYAMGLVKMTEFEPDKNHVREVRIASEDDPNHDIMPVHLNDNPGYIVKHGHVVATSGDDLVMKKCWRFWDLKSWLFGNLRYVFFTGTGSIYIHGYGRVSNNNSDNPDNRIKERHLIGYDTRTSFRMIRTETFINYWLSNKPLYDIQFLGQGSFLQQQSYGRRDEKIFRSMLEDFLGAFSKLLGF